MSDYTDDPYDVLGLDGEQATEREIKTAYRKLALKHHPDRHTDPEKKLQAQHEFARIAHAYEILTDPDLKREWESCSENFSDSGAGNSTSDSKTSSNKKTKSKKFRPTFNDAYEVWKKDFRELFGREYPGAEYDWVDPNSEEAKRIAKNPNRFKQLTVQKNEETKAILAIEADPSLQEGVQSKGPDVASKKKKGWNPFRRHGKKSKESKAPVDSPQEQAKPGSPNAQSTALVASNRKNNSTKGPSDLVVKSKNGSTALVGSSGASQALVVASGINNRPFHMEVEERQEGPVTITELIMKRPDGSTERVTMKTGIPGPPPRKMLEGPEEKRLAIEGPGSKKKAIEGDKKGNASKGKQKGNKAIKGGKKAGQKNSKKLITSGSEQQLVVRD